MNKTEPKQRTIGGVDESYFLDLLQGCEGYYSCPIVGGKLFGPLVGYAGEYGSDKKKYVGFKYFNFSMLDQYPVRLMEFAAAMTQLLDQHALEPDLIIGAPWAGVKFSYAVSANLDFCRHIFAEKKGDELILGRYEGAIRPGDDVIIGEELVNNASTTGKLIELVEAAEARVITIMCAINRSYPFRNTFERPGKDPIPIISVVEQSTPQYRQDDPAVAAEVAAGNVVWKPKYDWRKLKASMDSFQKVAD